MREGPLGTLIPRPFLGPFYKFLHRQSTLFCELLNKQMREMERRKEENNKNEGENGRRERDGTRERGVREESRFQLLP